VAPLLERVRQRQAVPAPGYPPQAGFPAQQANGGYDPQHWRLQLPSRSTFSGHGSAGSPSGDERPRAGRTGFRKSRTAARLRTPAGWTRAPQASAPHPRRSLAHNVSLTRWLPLPVTINGLVPMPGQDARGYDLGNYMPAGMGPRAGRSDAAAGGLVFGGAHGYDPALDPAYQTSTWLRWPRRRNCEQPYSDRACRRIRHGRAAPWQLGLAHCRARSSWRWASATCLAQGYKMMMGPSADGVTPVVKATMPRPRLSRRIPAASSSLTPTARSWAGSGEPGADPSQRSWLAAAAEPPQRLRPARPREPDANGCPSTS